MDQNPKITLMFAFHLLLLAAAARSPIRIGGGDSVQASREAPRTTSMSE